MSPTSPISKQWKDAWLHSDLVGIPVTLAVVGIMAVSAGLYLGIGNVAGVVVGKTLFAASCLGLIMLIPLLDERHGETTEGMTSVTTDPSRRVLVIANESLEEPTLLATLCDSQKNIPAAAMVVAPVQASTWLHELTNDVDRELSDARVRLTTALAALRAAGISANGHVGAGSPMRCLADGLRAFPATEITLLHDSQRGWSDAEQFAHHVKAELGIGISEASGVPAYAAAA